MTPDKARHPAIRHQLALLRRLYRAITWLLLLGSLAILVMVFHAGPSLLGSMAPAELGELLRITVWLVAVLIPTVGIYSVVSQYAFWNGWLTGLPLPGDVFAAVNGNNPLSGDKPASQSGRCYLVYLDGIHQSERDHPPRVSLFLNALDARLPPNTVLLKGLHAYTVTPARLADDNGSSWFWRRLFAIHEHHPNRWMAFLSAFLVQANNVIKVGISSDRRYGPILNYELALKVCLSLSELGFTPGPEHNVVLLGYSGGAEMALGMAEYLRRLCRCPVGVITFCGVFGGNQLLHSVQRISTVIGSRDPVAAFGQVAYPGRSPLLPLSNWNRARSRGQVHRELIAGMKHNGLHGPFSDRFRDEVISRVLRCLALPAEAESGPRG